MIRWHRAGWYLLRRYKSRPVRPPIPVELRHLIRRMATENPLWGEERIANELLLKLGLPVSPLALSANTCRSGYLAAHAAINVGPRPAQPRLGDSRLRLLRRGDGDLPAALWVCGDPSWLAPVTAFQRHDPPDGGLDSAATSRASFQSAIDSS
jgi:hypothetical protein